MLLFHYLLCASLAIHHTVNGAGSLSRIFKSVNKSAAPPRGDKQLTGGEMTGSKGPQMSKGEVAKYVTMLKKRFEVLGVSLDNYFTSISDAKETTPTDEFDCPTDEPQKESKPTSSIPTILTQLQEFISVESLSDHPMSSDVQLPSDQKDIRNQSELDKLKLVVSDFFTNNPYVEDAFRADAGNDYDGNTQAISIQRRGIPDSTLTGEISHRKYPSVSDEAGLDYPAFIALFLQRKIRGQNESRLQMIRHLSDSPLIQKKILKIIENSLKPRRRRRSLGSRKRNSRKERSRQTRKEKLRNRRMEKQRKTLDEKPNNREIRKRQCIPKIGGAKTNDTLSTNISNSDTNSTAINQEETDMRRKGNQTGNIIHNTNSSSLSDGIELNSNEKISGNSVNNKNNNTNSSSLSDGFDFNSDEKISSRRKGGENSKSKSKNNVRSESDSKISRSEHGRRENSIEGSNSESSKCKSSRESSESESRSESSGRESSSESSGSESRGDSSSENGGKEINIENAGNENKSGEDGIENRSRSEIDSSEN